MDIPRIFTISESEHRIHNPFTPEKYATLGRVLRMKPDTHILDPAAARVRCSAPGARSWHYRHRHRYEPAVHRAGGRRAEELGVSSKVHFIHNDAAGYVAEEKYDVAACVGATWIAGGFAGTVGLLAQSLKPGGIMLIGEPYWRQIPATEEIAGPAGSPPWLISFPFPTLSPVSTNSAMTWWKWCWRTRRLGSLRSREVAHYAPLAGGKP